MNFESVLVGVCLTPTAVSHGCQTFKAWAKYFLLEVGRLGGDRNLRYMGHQSDNDSEFGMLLIGIAISPNGRVDADALLSP